MVALISVPEVIILNVINLVGMISVASNRIMPLNVLLHTKIINYRNSEKDPKELFFHNYLFFGKSLGGNADKTNDHIREFFQSLIWLGKLCPKAGLKTTRLLSAIKLFDELTM